MVMSVWQEEKKPVDSDLPKDESHLPLVEIGTIFSYPTQKCIISLTFCNLYFMLNIAMSMVLADKHINHQILFLKTMDFHRNTKKLGNESKIHADFESS